MSTPTARQVSGLRIRLMGLPDEVLAGAAALGEVFEVIEVSDPYLCRGASRNVRIYLQVRFKNDVPGRHSLPASTSRDPFPPRRNTQEGTPHDG